jgi:peptide deformylase
MNYFVKLLFQAIAYFLFLFLMLQGMLIYYPREEESRYNIKANTVDACDLPRHSTVFREVNAKSYDWCTDRINQKPEVLELIHIMKLTVAANKYSGMVAANLGVKRRIMVTDSPASFINPSIKKGDESDTMKLCTFVCPHGEINIPMNTWVRVTYLTEEFMPRKERFEGMDACKIQYLMSSLDGINNCLHGVYDIYT